jgi:hypothetical protein
MGWEIVAAIPADILTLRFTLYTDEAGGAARRAGW